MSAAQSSVLGGWPTEADSKSSQRRSPAPHHVGAAASGTRASAASVGGTVASGGSPVAELVALAVAVGDDVAPEEPLVPDPLTVTVTVEARCPEPVGSPPLAPEHATGAKESA